MKPKYEMDLGKLTTSPVTGRGLKKPCRYAMYVCPSCSEAHPMIVNNVSSTSSMKCKKCSTKEHLVKHGDYKEVLYTRWRSMKARCSNPNHEHYSYYGAKGVSVCKEWLDYPTFKVWAHNNGYKEHLTIDRIHTDMGYSPENCRWVGLSTQAANKGIRRSNKSGFTGVTQRGSKWRVSITSEGKRTNLGTYSTAVLAAKAYKDYVLFNDLPHTLPEGV